MNDITPAEAMATIRKAAALIDPTFGYHEFASDELSRLTIHPKPVCDRCGGTGELVAVGNGRYIRLDQWNGDQGDLIDCPECGNSEEEQDG